MSHRRASIVLSLALLLAGPFLWGIGPNFKLEIYGCLIGYYASFSVTGDSTPVFATDSNTNFMEEDSGGDLFDESWSSESEGGTMAGLSYSRVLWSPGLDANYLTNGSQADAAIELGASTSSIGTAGCQALSATATSALDVDGTRTSETAWKTSRVECVFSTSVSASGVNATGGAGATVTWGQDADRVNIATTWSSTNGFQTVGFYMVDGQQQNIDNSSSGASGTAKIILQVKQQASSGDSNGLQQLPHTSLASTGLDSVGNSGGIAIVSTATTAVYAVGYPE